MPPPLLELDGAISHLTLQDSANSLFEKELSERNQIDNVKSQDTIDKIGTLDGFLLCERAAAELPEHVFHAKVSGLNISNIVEEDLMYFTSLTSIDLSDNHIEQMQPMKHFPVLRELNIACNGLNSLGLDRHVSNIELQCDFQSLKILDVSYNNITPEDVDALSKLPKLEKLDISHNGLRKLSNERTSTRSESTIANVDKENEREGTLAQTDVRFPSLRTLNADSNKLKGDCILKLSDCMQLKELRLANNFISKIPQFDKSKEPYSCLSGLRKLDLSYNKISDERMLNSLANIPDLVILLEGNLCLMESLGRPHGDSRKKARSETYGGKGHASYTWSADSNWKAKARGSQCCRTK